MLLGTSSGIVVPPIDELYRQIGYRGNGNNRTLGYSAFNRVNEEIVVISKVRTGGPAFEFIIGSSLFGANTVLRPKQTSGFSSQSGTYGSFGSTSVNVGNNDLLARNNEDIIHHIFMAKPGFMDIVEYTGNATAGRTVSHNLGVEPGAIWIKRTSGLDRDWICYWKAIGNTKHIKMKIVNEATTSNFNNTSPTSSQFTVGSGSEVNAQGSDYVAFLFAEDTADVIQCGGFAGNGGTRTINLGWEPGFVLYKGRNIGNNWTLVSSNASGMAMNLDEGNNEFHHSQMTFSSTGFSVASGGSQNQSGKDYIYLAIAKP